jgi:hypothetical protein
MAEPTLQDIFGSNATQDISSITISKADLLGLTADTENTGESLLVAIVLKAQNYLTQANFDLNIDQSVVIELGLPSFTTRGDSQQYRSDSLSINLAKPDTSATIDPDDY